MKLKEIAVFFFKLGVFGFGGPIAVIGMMEQETVERRGWLTQSEFSEIYAICKMLPGPVGPQVAIYLGQLRAGSRWGGVVAGVLFVLPAFLMVLGLSVLYKNTAGVAQFGPVLMGLQAAALVVVVTSTWALARPYKKERRAWVIAGVSALIVLFRPRWEPLVILGFGLFGGWLCSGGVKLSQEKKQWGFFPIIYASNWGHLLGTGKLMQLFWMCFKAGMFVFGTGLAVLPVLEADAVGAHHWITHSQFMDGMAIGQVTPGPFVITSTFIGYLAAGYPGAIAATLGMFLPSFINILFLVPRIWKRFSGTPGAQGFTSWAIPAVIGGIFSSMVKLGGVALVSGPAIVLFALALLIALWKNPPAWLLIPGAGLISELAHLSGLFS
ncbi:chromate efflux transporter [Bdellovibrionota bacterium FG-1]